MRTDSDSDAGLNPSPPLSSESSMYFFWSRRRFGAAEDSHSESSDKPEPPPFAVAAPVPIPAQRRLLPRGPGERFNVRRGLNVSARTTFATERQPLAWLVR